MTEATFVRDVVVRAKKAAAKSCSGDVSEFGNQV